jgi:hypothetical protein
VCRACLHCQVSRVPRPGTTAQLVLPRNRAPFTHKKLVNEHSSFKYRLLTCHQLLSSGVARSPTSTSGLLALDHSLLGKCTKFCSRRSQLGRVRLAEEASLGVWRGFRFEPPAHLQRNLKIVSLKSNRQTTKPRRMVAPSTVVREAHARQQRQQEENARGRRGPTASEEPQEPRHSWPNASRSCSCRGAPVRGRTGRDEARDAARGGPVCTARRTRFKAATTPNEKILQYVTKKKTKKKRSAGASLMMNKARILLVRR